MKAVLIFSVSICFSASALAAQNGRVVAATAVVREAPNKKAAAVAQVKQGDVVRISSKSREGWFKVLLPGTQNSPQFGWISAQELIPIDLINDMKAAKVQSGDAKDVSPEEGEPKPRAWSLAAYYQLTTVNPRDVQGTVGLTNRSLSTSTFAGELNLSPSQWVGLSIYLSTLGASEAANETQSYSVNTYLVGGLVEYYPLRTDYHRLGFGLGVLGARAYMDVKRIDSTTSQYVSGGQRFFTMGSMFRVTFRQYLLYHFGLGINGGYRYLTQKKITVAQTQTNLQLNGFFAELGLFIEF